MVNKPAGSDGPATLPPSQAVPLTCPSCGWANRPGAVRCEFCTALLAKDAEPPRPRPVECPHCGHVSAGLGRATNCPKCGRAYLEPPDAGRKLAVAGTDLAAWAKQRWIYLMIAGFVLIILFYQSVMSTGNAKVTTANNIRQIKKMLQIHEGMTGGFPATLEDMVRRVGPIPAHIRRDGWNREIRYLASSPRANSEGGEPGYTQCEVRSAGGDGDFGNDDDIVWKGTLNAP
jgi:hypothetical protein